MIARTSQMKKQNGSVFKLLFCVLCDMEHVRTQTDNVGCDKQARKEGLCARHYREKFGSSAHKPCCNEGCDKRAVKEGLCARHYEVWFRCTEAVQP